MENIEQKLNKKINQINPPRSLFESTMSSVTSDDLNRNNIMKDNIPSPYKTTYSFFVKKITYIGIPIVALAAYFIIVNTGVDNKIEVQNNPTPIVTQNVDNNEIISNTKLAEVDNNISVDDKSVDSIISDIISDADNDASLAINDSSDEAFINSELNQYDSFNSNTYEEII